MSKPKVRVKAGSRFSMVSAPVNTGLSGIPAPSIKRPYDAASVRGLGADWQTANPGVNAGILAGGAVLRARARDAYRQNGLASTIIDTLTAEAIGTGIVPIAATPDTGLNRELDELFALHADSIDADGLTDFYGLQTLAFSEMATAGEVFARIRPRRPEDGLPVPFQIQLLESEFLPLNYSKNFEDGRRILMGIERNAIGKRTRYHFYKRHPEDFDGTLQSNHPHDTSAVPAEMVMHLFMPSRAGQIRGETWLTRALIGMMQLADYQLSERVRKQNTAKLSLIIRRAQEGIQTAMEALAEAEEDDAILYEDDMNPEEGVATWTPGTTLVLDGAEDVQVAQTADVGGNFEAFVRVNHREIARSVGLLYEHLSGDWSTLNDRTLRVALQTFRRRIEQIQWNSMVHQFCRPTWGAHIDFSVSSGIIKPPRSMSDRQLRMVTWAPQSWPYIHPLQEVDTEIKKLSAGLTSRKRLLAERGEDIEQIDAEIAEDKHHSVNIGSGRKQDTPDDDEQTDESKRDNDV